MHIADAKKLGPVFAWGNFVSVVLNFFIMALIVFLIVKAINAIKRRNAEPPPPPAPAEPSSTDKLLMEIRDTLKAVK
jgi:large conductance mechanosensitive channel